VKLEVVGKKRDAWRWVDGEVH